MILNEEAREFLKEKFSEMRREVPIYVFFKRGVNDKYNELHSVAEGAVAVITVSEARISPIGGSGRIA